MNVLSLFDGMSCGQIALERAGIKVDKYFASEIDKYAITVSQANYADIIRLGNVLGWKDWNIDFSEIDLVLAGFPCQSWSLAGKQLGDKDERGMLFWTMLDITKHIQSLNPKVKFLFENVKMKKDFEEYITHHTKEALGTINKHLINSALVSAQSRERYYWTNIEGVEQPDDRGIVLRDILEDGSNQIAAQRGRYLVDGKRQDGKMLTAGLTQQRMEFRKDNKSNTLTTVQKDNLVYTHKVDNIQIQKSSNGIENIKKGTSGFSWFYEQQTYTQDSLARTLKAGGGSGNIPKVLNEDLSMFRKLTPVECERLQTLPDNFTAYVSNSQRYKMIGNGWTVDVITHILKNLC